MDALLQDLRLAVRNALRRPAVPLVAALSVAIGIGVNAAVFSTVDSLVLRDLPGVAEPDRVVEIGRQDRYGDWGAFDWPDYADLQDQATAFDALTAVDIAPMNLSDAASGARILTFQVTSGYFNVMGVRPALGRAFLPEEDSGPGQHPVAILSHRTWQERFQGDPAIVGQTIHLDREPYTIVGVAPEAFPGHLIGVRPEVYVPLVQSERGRRNAQFWEYRGTLWLQVLGRMRPGVSLDQANAQLTTIFARLAEAYPTSNANRSAVAAQAGLVPPEGRGPLAAGALVVGLLLLLVLAATCANVAGMLLSKAAARERDIAVRIALGSGRGPLVRHLAAEALLIFVIGGIGGILVAAWGLRFLDPNRFLPVPFPVTLDITAGWHALLFGALLTLGTAGLFGVLPAMRVARADLATVLRDQAGGSGRRAGRLRRYFVAGQVGVSILLLAVGALFLRSIQRAGDVDIGFDPDGVYVTTLDLDLEGYRSAGDALAFLDELVRRASLLPGVTGATASTDLPLDGGSSGQSVLPEGRDPSQGPWLSAYYASVTPSFFETLDIRLLQGRVFGSEDGATTARVAVVNQRLVDYLWPGENPLGRRIQYGNPAEWHTVIGVVAGTKADMITDNDSPQVYSLLTQDFQPDVHLALRIPNADPDAPARVASGLRAVDPALALAPVRSLSSFAGLGTLPHRLGAAAASILGVLALLLSAMGIYGVIAFSVAQRTREIGVRMALGAARGRVLGMVVREGLRLALPGVVVGSVLAAALGKLLGAFLLGISPIDPVAFGGVLLLLGMLIVAACLFPARRASAIEPAEALRWE